MISKSLKINTTLTKLNLSRDYFNRMNKIVKMKELLIEI